MQRCVIVGGAPIADYAAVRSQLCPDDFAIYCDSGLRHREALGLAPSLIVGDFDSHEDPKFPVPTIVLPRAKDDTDTVFAVREALRRGFSSFLLLGAAGGRLDHTLGNVSILLRLDSLGRQARLVDDFGEMEVVSRAEAEVAPSWAYFSLLAVDGTARGVDVSPARFPLAGATITPDYAYGISNEPLPGQTARIRVAEGRLLLLRIK